MPSSPKSRQTKQKTTKSKTTTSSDSKRSKVKAAQKKAPARREKTKQSVSSAKADKTKARSAADTPSSSSRPNVIVFFTDQQRWDTSGLHGNPLDLMPNFDRMAMAGTHIANSITCQPVSGPARSCLQTGLYATQTGCWQNGVALDTNLKTLADYFNEAGYTTSYIGKWHLSNHTIVPEEERGRYQRWIGSNVLELTSDAYDCRMFDEEGNDIKFPGYRVDGQTDILIRQIDDFSDQKHPFFIFCSYLEPHHQNHLDDFPAPTGYRERYTGRWIPPDLQALGGTSSQQLGGYYGMVKRLDEAFGRVLDALKSYGLDKNTIVLFTSDHGCHFKTRNSEYKRSLHECSVRVPTAFAGPGFQAGGRREEIVSLVDIVPTLLDACHIPVPESLPGRSLMPRLRGEKTEWVNEAFIQISESQTARAIRTTRWKYGITDPRDKEWATHSASTSYEEEYLYDLESDPYELQNLIDCESHKEVADYLKQRLLNAMKHAGEKAPRIKSRPKTKWSQRRVAPDEILQ